MTRSHTSWCTDGFRDPVTGHHECIHEFGEVVGRPGERIGVDLIRRPDDYGGGPELQIGIVDTATGIGVAIDLDKIDQLLALVAAARRTATSDSTTGAARSGEGDDQATNDELVFVVTPRSEWPSGDDPVYEVAPRPEWPRYSGGGRRR